MKIKKAELRHIVWEQMARRPAPNCEEGLMDDYLMYRAKSLPRSPVDDKRDAIIEYIKSNKNRLSLYCDGDCYQHHDGVVLYCYDRLIQEGKNGQED